MGILCRLGGHQPRPHPVWNEGYYFSRCRRCDRDLIGRFGDWHIVPRGYRVVWRPAEESPVAHAGLFPAAPSLSDLLLTPQAAE